MTMVFWKTSYTSEGTLDESFFLWLGQTSELEELGVDINELLIAAQKNESHNDNENQEESSK